MTEREEQRVSIGKNLARMREKRQVSQKDLAKATGITQTHLSNVEHGKNGIGLELLIEICNVLNCSLDECVFGKKAKATAIRFEPVKGAPYDTKLPQRSTKYSAGYDFFAPCDIEIPAHGVSKLIPMNVKAIMPGNMYLQAIIRSGLSMKHNIMLEASGVVDADYANNIDNDGNIGIKLRNDGDADYTIKKGERCMQGVFLKYYTTDNDVADGVRGGGYGSTGR